MYVVVILVHAPAPDDSTHAAIAAARTRLGMSEAMDGTVFFYLAQGRSDARQVESMAVEAIAEAKATVFTAAVSLHNVPDISVVPDSILTGIAERAALEASREVAERLHDAAQGRDHTQRSGPARPLTVHGLSLIIIDALGCLCCGPRPEDGIIDHATVRRWITDTGVMAHIPADDFDLHIGHAIDLLADRQVIGQTTGGDIAPILDPSVRRDAALARATLIDRLGDEPPHSPPLWDVPGP